MRDILPEIHAMGGELIFLGNGTPEQARWFGDQHGVADRVYTDPHRAVYKALGTRGAVFSGLHPRLLTNALRARRKGFRQTRLMGSAFQQGGVSVIQPDGSIIYRFRSRTAGDHPATEDVLAALRQAGNRQS